MTFSGIPVTPNSWADRAHVLTTAGTYDKLSVKDQNAKTIFRALDRYDREIESFWTSIGGALFILTGAVAYGSLKCLKLTKWTKLASVAIGYIPLLACFGISMHRAIFRKMCQLDISDPKWKPILQKIICNPHKEQGLISAAAVYGMDLTDTANS